MYIKSFYILNYNFVKQLRNLHKQAETKQWDDVFLIGITIIKLSL